MQFAHTSPLSEMLYPVLGATPNLVPHTEANQVRVM